MSTSTKRPRLPPPLSQSGSDDNVNSNINANKVCRLLYDSITKLHNRHAFKRRSYPNTSTSPPEETDTDTDADTGIDADSIGTISFDETFTSSLPSSSSSRMPTATASTPQALKTRYDFDSELLSDFQTLLDDPLANQPTFVSSTGTRVSIPSHLGAARSDFLRIALSARWRTLTFHADHVTHDVLQQAVAYMTTGSVKLSMGSGVDDVKECVQLMVYADELMLHELVRTVQWHCLVMCVAANGDDDGGEDDDGEDDDADDSDSGLVYFMKLVQEIDQAHGHAMVMMNGFEDLLDVLSIYAMMKMDLVVTYINKKHVREDHILNILYALLKRLIERGYVMNAREQAQYDALFNGNINMTEVNEVNDQQYQLVEQVYTSDTVSTPFVKVNITKNTGFTSSRRQVALLLFDQEASKLLPHQSWIAYNKLPASADVFDSAEVIAVKKNIPEYLIVSHTNNEDEDGGGANGGAQQDEDNEDEPACEIWMNVRGSKARRQHQSLPNTDNEVYGFKACIHQVSELEMCLLKLCE